MDFWGLQGGVPGVVNGAARNKSSARVINLICDFSGYRPGHLVRSDNQLVALVYLFDTYKVIGTQEPGFCFV